MKGPASLITALLARPLNVPMNEPFEIATGSRLKVENVLIEARLADGTRGYGECAPFSAVTRETQASALKAARSIRTWMEGRDCARFLAISRLLAERIPEHGSVRAGVEMAVLDAWSRQRGIPLWTYFGGSERKLRTDVTVTLVPVEAARRAARRILRKGISRIKIKVGRDVDEDAERVSAVVEEAPNAELIVDANEGYDARKALEFLRRLRRLGIRPALFEQPVPRGDWDGMTEVSRKGGIPVAADESVASLKDAWRMAKSRAASVVNIKLMKYGIAEALDVARVAKGAGLGLMIGGMVESSLAMGCAAHLAGGLGGFRFIDLDTPLWLARNPMRGLSIRRGGLYDLGTVRAGIGVVPRTS